MRYASQIQRFQHPSQIGDPEKQNGNRGQERDLEEILLIVFFRTFRTAFNSLGDRSHLCLVFKIRDTACIVASLLGMLQNFGR